MAGETLVDASSIIKERDDAVQGFAQLKAALADERTQWEATLKSQVEAIAAERDAAKLELAAFRQTVRTMVNGAVLGWFNQAIAPQWGRIALVDPETKVETDTEGWLCQMTPQYLADRLGVLEKNLAQALGAS